MVTPSPDPASPRVPPPWTARAAGEFLRDLAGEAALVRAAGTPPGGLGQTGAASPVDRLGWVDLPRTAGEEIPAYRALLGELRSEGCERLVVAAMGGSALVPEMLVAGLPRGPGGGAGRGPGPGPGGRPGLEVSVLQSLAPEAVREAVAPETLSRSAFLIASKSGATVETASFEAVILRALRARGGSPERQLLALSDPGSPLFERAAGYRRRFPGRSNVGGRFSALSPFGLLPAVLAGRRVEPALARAGRLRRALDRAEPGDEDPGFELGLLLARLHAGGRNRALLSASPGESALIPWIEQLLAECTGKGGRGILPVILPPPPRPREAGPGAFLVHLTRGADGDRERLAAAAAAGVPVIEFRTSPESLLADIYRWQVAVSVAAWRIGVDPFDEPDVEAAKAAARRAIGRPEAPPRPPAVGDAALAGFLAGSGAAGLVVNVFGHRSPQSEAALGAFQRELAGRLGVVPAVAFGPALLHSLGQIEKGGPPAVRVLMLTWADGADEEVPAGAWGGRAVGCAELRRLQAAADHRALRERGRAVLWLDSPLAGEAGLAALLGRARAAAA